MLAICSRAPVGDQGRHVAALIPIFAGPPACSVSSSCRQPSGSSQIYIGINSPRTVSISLLNVAYDFCFHYSVFTNTKPLSPPVHSETRGSCAPTHDAAYIRTPSPVEDHLRNDLFLQGPRTPITRRLVLFIRSHRPTRRICVWLHIATVFEHFVRSLPPSTQNRSIRDTSNFLPPRRSLQCMSVYSELPCHSHAEFPMLLSNFFG